MEGAILQNLQKCVPLLIRCPVMPRIRSVSGVSRSAFRHAALLGIAAYRQHDFENASLFRFRAQFNGAMQ